MTLPFHPLSRIGLVSRVLLKNVFEYVEALQKISDYPGRLTSGNGG